MDHIRLRRNWRPRCRLLVLPTLVFACLSLLLIAGLSLYGEEDSTESQHHHSALGDVDTSEALVDEQLDTIDPSGKDLTSVDAVIDAYRRFHDARGRHSRLASPSYRRWAEFALGRQCAVHEQEYAQIEKDIGRFRIAFAQRWLSSEVAKRTATRRKLDLKRLDTWSEADVEALVAEVEPHASVISASAVDEAARIPRVARLRVADGQVHITVNSPELDQSIVSALREVAQLPGSPVDLVFNMLDEPRVLKRPPDTRRYNATEDMALRYNGDEGMYEKKEGCGSIIPLMESVCDGVSRNGGGISRQQLESVGWGVNVLAVYLILIRHRIQARFLSSTDISLSNRPSPSRSFFCNGSSMFC